MHYAGVPCAMDEINSIAEEYGLFVIEDAAQALLSKYKNRFLGTLGHMGTLSFHETKNIISGEGGALLLNDERFVEKGRNNLGKRDQQEEVFPGRSGQVHLGGSWIILIVFVEIDKPHIPFCVS